MNLDLIGEIALIELSRIERETMEMYSHSTRRPASDAKRELEKAGYFVTHLTTMMYVDREQFGPKVAALDISGGTVDNDAVLELLNSR